MNTLVIGIHCYSPGPIGFHEDHLGSTGINRIRTLMVPEFINAGCASIFALHALFGSIISQVGHSAQGDQYPLEVHFVHYNSLHGNSVGTAIASGNTDALLVVGVLFRLGSWGEAEPAALTSIAGGVKTATKVWCFQTVPSPALVGITPPPPPAWPLAAGKWSMAYPAGGGQNVVVACRFG